MKLTMQPYNLQINTFKVYLNKLKFYHGKVAVRDKQVMVYADDGCIIDYK